MFNSPNWLQTIITEEHLPASFEALAIAHYLPLAEQIIQWKNHQKTPLVVGINGAQGTGKSTLSKVVSVALEQEHQCQTAVVSIDDLYHTKATRAELAQTVHPLMTTRGVPGTHDTNLGIQLLLDLKAGKKVPIPSFDKSTDDRRPESDWIIPPEPVDVIIFEGWCIGAIAQETAKLDHPINQLEKADDPDARWRSYVNAQLSGVYSELFAYLDRLVMLKAPDFECVHEWRSEQERKLHASIQKKNIHPDQASGLMTEDQITRFIMHYERLTRWMFSEMPQRADILFKLTKNHTIGESSK